MINIPGPTFCRILVLSGVIFGLFPAQARPGGSRRVVPLPPQLLQLKKDDPRFVKVASSHIDKFVVAEIKRQRLRPTAAITDAKFLRRTYLNIIGRIPTADEAQLFLFDDDPNKRYKLVEQLLDSDGYEMSMYHFWADLLRIKDNLGGGRNTRAYQKWIRASIKQNKPYDEMVYQLITAEGGIWEPGNGAVGYYVRDRGMPLDNMANTTRVFMGTQIACAQCHDHPHDKWSQMAFFQMAAFTHNLKSFAQTQRFPRIRDKFDVDEMPEARRWERVDRWVRYEFLDAYIMGDGAGRIRLPNDYQYKDGKPREWVGARTMLGKKVQNRKEDKDLKNSRKRLGDWMISTENPNFTSVISNRMWKRAMGIGLVEPLDNFTENTKPSNPALLSFLDRLMVHIDFDLKLFQKIIYNSQTFGRDTNPKEVDTKQPYYFHGYALQRMSAEQIWDSMLALTIDDPDGPKRAYLGDQVIWNGKTVLKGMTMADLQKEVTSLKPDQYVKYIQDLSKRLKEGYKGKEEPMMMEMMVASGSTKGLRRASELPSPAPASHFLRTFGQSDREVIENSTRVGDVTQVLSLMNGHVQQHILNNDKAAIIVKVRESDDVDKRIETIFLSVLCRKPSEAEMEIMRKEVADRDFRGIENIIAALINSSEFIHIH